MDDTYGKVERENTTRQPFDVVRVKGQKFRLQPGSIFLSLWNGLVIMTAIGLFAYFNSYFLPNLSQLINGTVYSKSTQAFPCNQYFCDMTMYNLLNYNTFYQDCNLKVCQNTICDGYSCGDALLDPTNYYPSVSSYYACYPKCVASMANAPVPSSVFAGYIVGIVAASLFALSLLLALIYGIVMAIMYKELDGTEKVGLAVTVFFPGLKYTFFRERTEWENFQANTKLMIIFDYLIFILSGCIWAMYIYLATVGFLASSVEIVLFFFLLANYLAHIGIVSRNSRVFWRLKDLIRIAEAGY